MSAIFVIRNLDGVGPPLRTLQLDELSAEIDSKIAARTYSEVPLGEGARSANGGQEGCYKAD